MHINHNFSSLSKFINGYQTSRKGKFGLSLHLVLINHTGDKLGTQAFLLLNLKSNLALTGLC